jgi:hypothetical protein
MDVFTEESVRGRAENLSALLGNAARWGSRSAAKASPVQDTG